MPQMSSRVFHGTRGYYPNKMITVSVFVLLIESFMCYGSFKGLSYNPNLREIREMDDYVVKMERGPRNEEQSSRVF